MLTHNQRTQYSVGCPSLLRWSSLHHNIRVICCLAPLSLSSAAVVSPSLRQCWMVPAPPLLAGSSGVQRRSSWTSAVTSPQAPSLGLDLWVSCVAPSRRKFALTEGAIPCGAEGSADGGVDAVRLFPPC